MALVLKNMRVGPFAGISEDHPVVLEFPPVAKNTKKRPITKLTGDQELGKSSLIHFLLHALCQRFGMKKQELVNLESNEMQGEIEFSQNDQTWKVVVTKTTFKLFRLMEVEDEKAWIPVGEEVLKLKQLVGNVAISPIELKTSEGAKQVDWLFKMLNVPPDIVEASADLGRKISEVTKVRASANKDRVFLQTALSQEPLYNNWEESEATYKEEKTLDKLQAKLRTADAKRGRLVEGRERVATISRKISEKKLEIEDFKRRILAAEKELNDLEKGKAIGDKWVEDHENYDQEYKDVHKEFMTLNEYIVGYRTWQRIKQDKKDMDEFETLVQECDTKKANHVKKRRSLLKDIVDLDGLEVVTEQEIDGKAVGIYFDGKNPNQLSESELFDLYVKLCRAQGVTMVVVENITSFGSKVVQTLNQLAKSGVYVWATEMRRGQQDLKIEFIDQIK